MLSGRDALACARVLVRESSKVEKNRELSCARISPIFAESHKER